MAQAEGAMWVSLSLDRCSGLSRPDRAITIYHDPTVACHSPSDASACCHNTPSATTIIIPMFHGMYRRYIGPTLKSKLGFARMLSWGISLAADVLLPVAWDYCRYFSTVGGRPMAHPAAFTARVSIEKRYFFHRKRYLHADGHGNGYTH